MDASDADFDSYWENESRNNNRNRIRVGRQYQATVPALLRPGESDGRRLEDLETLRWRPESLSDQSIDEYLSMAKAVSLFARAMDKWQAWGEGGPEGCCLQTALRGLSDFVTSHHGCHHDAGCQVGPTLPCHWTPTEASLFARALDECGKNFGAIKKDFLPWKPVKSLIEFYYQGRMPKQESDGQEQEAGCSTSTGASCTSNCSTSKCTANCTSNCISNCIKNCIKKEVKEEPVEEDEEEEREEEKQKGDEPPPEGTAEEAPGVSGPEVKPMRAKPVKAAEEGPASVAPVGSLKFFLGGRLVLKLSAQEGGAWVEAQDTPRLGRPRQPPPDDASDEEEPSPPGSGGGGPPQKGTSRCTSWPETATPGAGVVVCRRRLRIHAGGEQHAEQYGGGGGGGREPTPAGAPPRGVPQVPAAPGQRGASDRRRHPATSRLCGAVPAAVWLEVTPGGGAFPGAAVCGTVLPDHLPTSQHSGRAVGPVFPGGRQEASSGAKVTQP
ncbi:arginine-glutamic acid dipeptide repeats protein isoform X2 [Ixodes scapularis]|uniref:arginine-glutamic acid dipeptide repeats protein isoform X2 n=1 Tax=Ixodes scapularis TaxID=6945 RepID=UPI001A9DE8DD|nr:arginine-glutamic acid dipeptide repeats protein isoform X2 [Ixodes scapularis]